MGCMQSRPILAHLEEGIFFLGSIYSTIVSYVSHFLNRFYNLLLSPLFRLDENIPSRICDERGVCHRPKDRLMQKRKTDERIKRAEYAAKGLDPRLALKPKESRNASTTALVHPELTLHRLDSNKPAGSPDSSKDERPVWVMGNIPASAATTREDKKRRSVEPQRTARTMEHAAHRNRRESAPVQHHFKLNQASPREDRYKYDVLATAAARPPPARSAAPPAAPPASKPRHVSNTIHPTSVGALDDSFAAAADRLKQNHRRSLQVPVKKATAPPAMASTTTTTTTNTAHPLAGAAGTTDARASFDAEGARRTVRRSVDIAGTSGRSSPASMSSTPAAAAASSGSGFPPTQRGSIADLASAATNAKKTKERKAWRGEISKVAKSRVGSATPTSTTAGAAAATPAATMGRHGGSPLTGGVVSAQSSPDLTVLQAPPRARTFA